ncbi:MFS transporter [Nocardia stercoris]|uniref:MFS transporter n=2 Tax=Nocardia stercoris TaxID=2483361 RepID=A0A3M2LCG9_9NOCA|nr:MFS transporter [Nocardia stercoris]
MLLFSQLLIWLDGTILTNAFETLADPVRGLGATPGQLQWATGAYTLVFATLTFTGGALGDRFGHRNTLLTGMAVFGLASVVAAYAGSPDQLTAARVAMGVGAALLMPATMAVISWTFEPAQRAAAYGAMSAFAGVGIAAGPVLSGLLLQKFWWGSVFIVNVPVVLVGTVCIALVVPNFRSPVARRLDLPGLALSIAGLGALAYGLIRAGQDGSFARPAVWGTIVAGLLVLAGFVLVELRVPAPSFDPRLLRDRAFAGGNIALMLLFLAMTGSSFYGAFYLQGPRQLSALQSGLLMLPAAAGVMIGSPLSVRLVRRSSARVVSTLALLITAACMAAVCGYGLHTSIVLFEVLMFVQGTATGMVTAPLTGAVLGSLPPARAGAGSAVNSTLRQTGSVLGIAVGGTITTLVYQGAIESAVAARPPAVRDAARVSAESARHVARTTGDPGLVAAADDAFLHAAHVAAGWTAGFVVLAAVVVATTLAARRVPPVATVAPEPELASS